MRAADVGADTTFGLSRSALRGARAKGAPAFRWPSPPYYDPEGPEAIDTVGDCLLTFVDGARASGTLRQFSPDDETLKFERQDSGEDITIAFANLLRLELRAGVLVRRQDLPASVQQRVSAASNRQPFQVRLTTDEVFAGTTVGHVEALCGLFLFPPGEDGRVTRCFVPALSIRSYDIGKPFGQILVDEKLASPADVTGAIRRQIELRSRKVGEYLTDHQIVTPEQLSIAIRKQRSEPSQKLGETLVSLGYLSADDLDNALEIEKRNRSLPLGQILAEMGAVEPEMVNAVMAKKLGIPCIDLKSFEIAPEILKKITANIAHRYQVIPLAQTDKTLVIALENPMDMAKMQDLRFITGSKLMAVMASSADIRDALRRHYGAPGLTGDIGGTSGAQGQVAGQLKTSSSDAAAPIEDLTTQLAAESAELELNEQHAVQSDTTLVRLVNKIILDAVEQKASDIHIESNPGTRETRVRFRRDGELTTYIGLPAQFRRAVISRIKIMSQLDITERRKPQDGKIDFIRFGPAQVELRVVTVPTANGLEDVVMRVLSTATPVEIDNLGFAPDVLAAVMGLMSRPHGLILVCGPTGSGKTTTLHSLLSHINTEGRKIWTAEDPIEIVQPGLRQVQVNTKIGWTFAAALRSFMRADPDVVMVGEMRDPETAKSGIEASLTGHLVLSTLHTNGAAESVVRLLDLGMDPFNFADALLGVLSQRLMRCLCADCKVRYTPTASELEELAKEYCGETGTEPAQVLESWRQQHAGDGDNLALYRAKGCEQCGGSGYRGRVGVHELLVASAATRRLIQQRSPIAEIHTVALANGMRTLKQDGIVKMLRGLTDLKHVRGL